MVREVIEVSGSARESDMPGNSHGALSWMQRKRVQGAMARLGRGRAACSEEDSAGTRMDAACARDGTKKLSGRTKRRGPKGLASTPLKAGILRFKQAGTLCRYFVAQWSSSSSPARTWPRISPAGNFVEWTLT